MYLNITQELIKIFKNFLIESIPRYANQLVDSHSKPAFRGNHLQVQFVEKSFCSIVEHRQILSIEKLYSWMTRNHNYLTTRILLEFEIEATKIRRHTQLPHHSWGNIKMSIFNALHQIYHPPWCRKGTKGNLRMGKLIPQRCWINSRKGTKVGIVLTHTE